MSACGLDFGTSNTTLGRTVDYAPVLVALEAGLPHNSERDLLIER